MIDRGDRSGCIVGMRREARLLGRLSRELMVGCAAADPARARLVARRLIDQGVAGLVSFGLAGGLDPALPPGTILLPPVVVLPDGRALRSDPAWRQRAAERLPEARSLALAGSDRALVGAADKAALRDASGAAAVDMESHAVSDEAVAAGLPFLVIRAIADPAGRTLPAAALAGLSADGSARPWAVLVGLLRRPDQLIGVIRLIGDSAAGFSALGRVGRRLGPGLAFA